MSPLHNVTPLLEHRVLSRELNKSVWLKMESSQPSGSFKLRGIGLLCQRAAEKGAKHFICPSGGNAGYATAVAGATLGLQTTIVLPQTAPENVRQAVLNLGAGLKLHGANWDDANRYAMALTAADMDAIYVPPFDHPDIWDGNSSMMVELGGHDFDVVICSVGGGGLLSGVIQGLHKTKRPNVPVIAVETEGAACLHAAMQAGKVVSLDKINTIAHTLGSKQVAEHAFKLAQRHPVHSITVSDARAVNACLRFADDMRTLVEPACGAALSVVYDNLPVVEKFQKPLVIVCGGIGVDLAKLSQWRQDFKLA